MPSTPTSAPLAACILAAGKGTRMRSRLVKVLHPFLGKAMVLHLIDTAFRAGAERVVTVVGHQGHEVRQQIEAAYPGWELAFVLQAEQRGTGHALREALPALAGAADVVVLYGDTPLLQASTVAQLVLRHRAGGNAMTIATFHTAEATGYGRIVRAEDGRVLRIVEHADASPDELRLDEVNAGVCVIRGEPLAQALAALAPHQAQGELYLTDLVEGLAERGVGAFVLADPIEAQGINTRAQLARLEEVGLDRLRQAWMDRGVSMQGPASIRIEAQVDLGEDTVLGPGVQLLGRTRIGQGCRIDTGAQLDDCELGDFVHVKAYTIASHARLATGVAVGPFAHLRPGTELGEEVKIGNFVETKKARFGPRSKASHLSYLGDCDIGKDVNVGAGTITCNYDGVEKHRTVIGDGVFVGSDTQFVAPVSIGSNATIAAGTTVVSDVPEGALVLTRCPQKHVADYYARRRKPREDAKRAAREGTSEKG